MITCLNKHSHIVTNHYKLCMQSGPDGRDENPIETSRWKSELHQGEAVELYPHLGSNFELITVSPPYSLSTQTPLANFHTST